MDNSSMQQSNPEVFRSYVEQIMTDFGDFMEMFMRLVAPIGSGVAGRSAIYIKPTGRLTIGGEGEELIDLVKGAVAQGFTPSDLFMFVVGETITFNSDDRVLTSTLN